VSRIDALRRPRWNILFYVNMLNPVDVVTLLVVLNGERHTLVMGKVKSTAAEVSTSGYTNHF
jgi:hypothetical protein